MRELSEAGDDSIFVLSAWCRTYVYCLRKLISIHVHLPPANIESSDI